ncbi:Carbonyl reductase [NADPH] 3 [Holothuria leucospilota]|uniref:Carbonyl reductase [NADPH] 3 n=1 Tax=Holothuria leucospilota TaxID=206669 RepID=A0A9Q0YN98_HOLLE|nr:Carbonyl reductase [NADPH] 3 [Holothuria leucospilota]
MSRIAVVTGSNKGIGFACVRALCKQLKPEDVVYLTARKPDLGKKAVLDLEKEGLKPRFHQLDISDKQSVEALRDHLKKEHGGLDILINNAATAYKAKDQTPFSEQAKVTNQVNYFDNVQAVHILSPLLRANARVVNVCSFVANMTWGKMGNELKEEFKNLSSEDQLNKLVQKFIDLAAKDEHTKHGFPNTAYGFSKVAFSAYTRLLDREFQKDSNRPGMVAFAADPGWVVTDMSSQSGNKNIDEGADTLVWLALQPEGATEGRGEMFSDRKLHQVFV